LQELKPALADHVDGMMVHLERVDDAFAVGDEKLGQTLAACTELWRRGEIVSNHVRDQPLFEICKCNAMPSCL
jgi:hypothetical protein